MKFDHKLINSAFLFVLTALTGCDEEDLVDDHGEMYEFDQDRELGAHQSRDSLQQDDETREEVTQELPAGPDAFTDAPDPSAARCVGYYNGGNFCLASCWDKPGTWIAVGHLTNTAYGQCSGKVDSYCAWHGGTYGACWGWP